MQLHIFMKAGPKQLNFPFRLSLSLTPWSRHSPKRTDKTEEISQRELNETSPTCFSKGNYNRNLINLNAYGSNNFFFWVIKNDAHTLQQKSLYNKTQHWSLQFVWKTVLVWGSVFVTAQSFTWGNSTKKILNDSVMALSMEPRVRKIGVWMSSLLLNDFG